jgi:hypothetical protein
MILTWTIKFRLRLLTYLLSILYSYIEIYMNIYISNTSTHVGLGTGRGGADFGCFSTRPAPCGFCKIQPVTRAQSMVSARVRVLRGGEDRCGLCGLYGLCGLGSFPPFSSDFFSFIFMSLDLHIFFPPTQPQPKIRTHKQ